tara:strand:+ start:196 stop:939 length:744 start_codon:yes stop_codon:yes gene_type:complete
MCTVVLGLAAVAGAGTAVADRQAKMAKYRAQKAAVDRSNAMAKLKYQNDTMISAYRDQQKLKVFEAQLSAQASARQALYKQLELNQQEGDRAKIANQLKLGEKVTEAQLEGQTQLAESIKAQGTILASGQNPGQSMLLELMDVERQLGFQQAAVNRSLFDANQSAAMTEYGIELDQYGADTRAINSLPSGPLFAPEASFQTVRPIKQSGPSKPSILGSIMKGVTAGVGVGSGIGHASGGDTPWWKTS